MPSDAIAQAKIEAQERSMSRKPREAFTLVLDGLEVPVLSARVMRAIDVVAPEWSAEISWVPGRDKALDERVRPYSYCPAQVYLGPKLVNNGLLYVTGNDLDAGDETKTLKGASLTADLVDSHVPPEVVEHVGGQWRYSWTGLSVWNIANAICPALGIGVMTDIGDVTLVGQERRVTEPFEEVKAKITETYAALITRLASQRGMLVTSDEYGNLFLTAARTAGLVVANLEEGRPPVQKFAATFDGRKRFHTYAVYGQSGMADDIHAEAVDDVVPSSRTANFVVGDVSAGNVSIAAAWRRSRQLAEALTIPLPVSGWYAPRDELWTPNTKVSLTAPSLHCPDGFTFLVRAVEYLHEQNSQAATLYLVPPQAYTGEDLEEPWS